MQLERQGRNLKPHVKLYLTSLGYDESDWIKCEIPECGRQAVDIHHIERRGMGGTKAKDDILNLMALCRECHVKYGDKKQYKSFLKSITNERATK